MAPLDTEKLQEIAERLKKRTPGNWRWLEKPAHLDHASVYSDCYPDGSNAVHDGGNGWSICHTRDRSLEKRSVLWPFPFGENGENDGDFIAHAPEDISALLDEVHRLKEERQMLAKVLRSALPCIRNSDRGEKHMVYAEAEKLLEANKE